MLGDRSVLFRRRVEEPAACSVALKSNVFSDATVEEAKLKSAQTSLLFISLKSWYNNPLPSYHVWVKEWYAWITSLEAIVDSDWSIRSPSFSDLYAPISVIIWNNRSNTNSSALLPNVVQTDVINARLLRVFHAVLPSKLLVAMSYMPWLIASFIPLSSLKTIPIQWETVEFVFYSSEQS